MTIPQNTSTDAENPERKSILDLLGMPGMEDIEFDVPPRLGNDFVRPAKFFDEDEITTG